MPSISSLNTLLKISIIFSTVAKKSKQKARELVCISSLIAKDISIMPALHLSLQMSLRPVNKMIQTSLFARTFGRDSGT